jgi:ubiquinone/menaquinone biosynthesis C-methylase UbiE
MLRSARRWWRKLRAEQLAPRAAFDRLARSYDAQDNPLWALERPELGALLPPDLGGWLTVDLGGGTGYWAAALARRGARRTVVVDLSHGMLRSGAGARPGLDWIQGDLQRLPLRGNSFDLAVAGCCLSYAGRLGRALEECARILRRGGLLLISDYHPDGLRPGWTRGFALEDRQVVPRSREYRPAELAAAAHQAGLEIETLQEVAADQRLARFDRERRGLEPLESIRGLKVVIVARLRRR